MRITLTLCPAEAQAFGAYIASAGLVSYPHAIVARDLLVFGMMARAIIISKKKGKK